MLEFREPLFLWISLLSIPLFFVMLRRGGRIRCSSLSMWAVKATSFRAKTSFIPALLLALSFVALSVTLAGPRVPGGVIKQHREGIAMMLAIDKSGSMAALDMSKGDKEQDRLDALKDVLGDFIKGNGKLKGRYDDAIGIVSFASYPDSDCPLTLDHVTLMQLVNDISIVTDREESGTAIGDALGLSVERLRESESASKVIILLTDGVNNTGYEDPIEAARMAAQFGIKVYTIGIGTNGFAPVRLTNPFTGRSMMRQMPVELDEKMLTQIADMTGGLYFRATNREGLEAIYEKIDALEKTKISEDRTTHYDEKYFWSLAIGLILALCGLILRMTYYRRMP